MRASHLRNTVVLFNTALDRMRELSVHHWDDPQLQNHGFEFGSKDAPELSFATTLDRPMQFIDLRLSLPRLLEDFAMLVRKSMLGSAYTCAMLGIGLYRCWGSGAGGGLGYGNANNIGDDESPASVGNVPFSSRTKNDNTYYVQFKSEVIFTPFPTMLKDGVDEIGVVSMQFLGYQVRCRNDSRLCPP